MVVVTPGPCWPLLLPAVPPNAVAPVVDAPPPKELKPIRLVPPLLLFSVLTLLAKPPFRLVLSPLVAPERLVSPGATPVAPLAPGCVSTPPP